MNAEKITAHGWTADLPDGWEDRSLITLVGATDARGFAANIVVTREKSSGATLEEFAARQLELMRGEIGSLQILDERTIELNGRKVFQRLQRFAVDESQIIQQVQTFFRAADVILVVSGTATLESFDASIPAFKNFVETFEIN